MKKLRGRLVYLILVLVLILLFFPVVREKTRHGFVRLTSPLAQSFSSLGRLVASPFHAVANIGNLRRENDRLSAELLQLEVDRSQITELENENKLLKKELGFLADKDSAELVPTRIIERDPTSFLDSITLDRGQDAGLEPGMAVLSSGAMVGEIKEVYKSSAKATLITGKDSIVQAMLQNSRSKGIIKGGISGLFLENIVQDTSYNVGEMVVTSGLGGKIEAGIPVGRASNIQPITSGLFKSIPIEPLVDLSKLEIVFVAK